MCFFFSHLLPFSPPRFHSHKVLLRIFRIPFHVIQGRMAVSSVTLQSNSPSAGAVPYTINEFDRQGNIKTIISINGKHHTLASHAYDSKGRLVKQVYYDSQDTSKVISWDV